MPEIINRSQSNISEKLSTNFSTYPLVSDIRLGLNKALYLLTQPTPVRYLFNHTKTRTIDQVSDIRSDLKWTRPLQQPKKGKSALKTAPNKLRKNAKYQKTSA
eukprot:gene628-1215_t